MQICQRSFVVVFLSFISFGVLANQGFCQFIGEKNTQDPNTMLGGKFGDDVEFIGDLDGDGFPELAVGEPDLSAVHIFFLDSMGCVRNGPMGFISNFNPMPLQREQFGTSIAQLGPFDPDDAIPDIAVGVLRDSATGTLDQGAVWIVFLDASGNSRLDRPPVKIGSGVGGGPPLNMSDEFSHVECIGDLDGDGTKDLAVGTPGDTNEQGAVYILFLNSDGTVRTSTKISSSTGNGPVLSNMDCFGQSLALLPDIDGDGNVELAVGAPGDDDGGSRAGAVWILFLNSDGTARVDHPPQKISVTSGGFSGSLESEDLLGVSLDATNAFDTPVPTLLIGAFGDDDGEVGGDPTTQNKGAIWKVVLDAAGAVDSNFPVEKISSTEGGFAGPLTGFDRFGSGISITDVNGDGISDLAVGASRAEDASFRPGSAWILLRQGCTAGNVNLGVGPRVDVLKVNSQVGTVSVPLNQDITVSFDNALAGPISGAYVLWVWTGLAVNPVNLIVGGENDLIGCLVNPTPLHSGMNPQPFRCLRSPQIPQVVCRGVSQLNSAPPSVPFSVTKSGGLGIPASFILQGLVRDMGSTSPRNFSVTNAVRLSIP